MIDGHGGQAVEHATVLIEDDRIVAAGPSSQVPTPADVTVIDVTHKYLLPGLMDGNVHLLPWPSWTYIEFLARYEDRFDDIILEAAQVALAAGFTTVFDSMGPLDSLMAVRERINAGSDIGARLFVAGNIVGFRAVFTSSESMASASQAFQQRINSRFEANGGPDLCWLPPHELYAAMIAYVSQGVDFVKYGATGDGDPVNSEVGQGATLRFSSRQQQAIVDAVHNAGKIVQTHTTSAEALHVSLEAGNDMGQHSSFTGPARIYDETIELMLAQGYSCGTQWAPLTDNQKERLAVRDFSRPDLDQFDNLENSVRLIEAGVPQLLTTDAGTIDPDIAKDLRPRGGLGGQASIIGEAEFLNARAMVDRGMTPMQVIQAATLNVARAYGIDEDLGTVQGGKLADLVVLGSDPLANVENLRCVELVIKSGSVIDRRALPTDRLLTASRALEPGAIRHR